MLIFKPCYKKQLLTTCNTTLSQQRYVTRVTRIVRTEQCLRIFCKQNTLKKTCLHAVSLRLYRNDISRFYLICIENSLTIFLKYIITFSKRDAQSSPIFSQLCLIKFMDLVTMQTAVFMFQYCHNLSPKAFDNYFTFISVCVHLILCRSPENGNVRWQHFAQSGEYEAHPHRCMEEFENRDLFLRLGLPSTLVRHENGAFQKHSSNPRNLRTPGLRFSVERKHFKKNDAITIIMIFPCPSIIQTQVQNVPENDQWSNISGIVWTENIWCVFREWTLRF